MSSETSTPYTPASTSTTTTGNEAVTLADEIKKYKTAELIDFLRKEEDLGLDDDDLEIIRLGPATALVDFAKECKDKKLRAFSTYRSLKEVLKKYGIDGKGTDTIPLFSLQTHEIQDSNEHFKQCMAEILVRLKNYGTLVVDSLEAMRNEKRNVIEGFAQNIVQLESSYETNKRKRKRDDGDDFDYLYGIVTTARDWHFLLYTPGKISQGSKLPLSIEFSEDALDKKSPEDEPDRKRIRIEGYRMKK
ncbi:hypothetical protein C1646_759644 [Rhizophagus diaphanus]|nr:hypothetical protein C1646_759644 [Rhizophagus diaphanus] [Rhizophagus sp. MUCL 43196]